MIIPCIEIYAFLNNFSMYSRVELEWLVFLENADAYKAFFFLKKRGKAYVNEEESIPSQVSLLLPPFQNS